MRTFRIITFVGLGLFLTLPSFAQQNWTMSINSLLEKKVPRTFNGTIVLSKNGKIIYEKTKGLADLDKKIPLKRNYRFLVGSISKQFTAVLVLREVQKGHIQLQRNIRFYLPRFKQKWGDSVTVQQLLNHTSGIAAWDKNLVSKPGTRFKYTNINYKILGQIIEKTSGQSYARLTSGLFKECGMTLSTVPPAPGSGIKLLGLIKGYSENPEGRYQEEDIMDLLDSPMMGVPASGMVSTAEDLTKWLYALHNGKLITANSYHMMISDAVSYPHRWGEVKYGDGILVDYIDNIREFGMGGYVPGFISTMIYYPDTKISLVILENISPNPSDMNRVYYFHDQIRKIIRTMNDDRYK